MRFKRVILFKSVFTFKKKMRTQNDFIYIYIYSRSSASMNGNKCRMCKMKCFCVAKTAKNFPFLGGEKYQINGMSEFAGHNLQHQNAYR